MKSEQRRKFLEIRIEDLMGVIERRSQNPDAESVKIVEAAKKNLREAQFQLLLLTEEENRLG